MCDVKSLSLQPHKSQVVEWSCLFPSLQLMLKVGFQRGYHDKEHEQWMACVFIISPGVKGVATGQLIFEYEL